MKYRLILYLLLLSVCQGILAQYYDTGEDPASIKWKQIKTSHFTVIYPESYGIEGVKFVKSLDDSYIKLTSLYSVKKVRIPVIIHNYTTFSNGYVAWAPKRMEIYPTPEQGGIPLDPLEQLTTHELTHVLQMVSLNKGFTKAMSVLSGEQFTGAVSALLPLWFMEGDAVFAESLLSPSGRGRAPSFQKQMKAITLENPKMYSYDKILAGSYKNFIPDYYQYGYQMIAWSYAKYGPQLWNKTLDYTAKNPFTINPVNLSLSMNSGLTKSKLFSETFDSLKAIWQREDIKTNPVSYELLSPSKKNDYVNYHSPVITGKDTVIAIKTSFSSSPEFVLINLSDRSEKIIHIPGDIYPYYLSGSNGRIAWVENRPDPRWENRTYSVIKIMDVRRKITRQVSFKSRYLAASISFDGRLIAAVENTISNQNNLIIIDAFNGDVVNKIPVTGNSYPQRPQWSQNGEDISIVFLSDKGEGIMSYSLRNSIWHTLIAAGRNDLQAGFLRNDSLFFVSSSSGTDNIYILTPDKKISKLTNSKYGAYDPYPVAGNVIFSDYSFSGYNICEANINKSEIYQENNVKDLSFLINRFDTIKIKSADISLNNNKPEPYRKWSHLFRFHSWMPFYVDIEKIQADPTSVRPGFTLMSQNLLSTVISTFGYEYTADKTHMFHAGITLQGWLPVIESRLDYGGSASVSKPGSISDPITIKPGFVFSNTVSVPLNYSTGRFTQYFRPSITTEYNNDYVYIRERGTYDYGQTLFSGRLFFNNYYQLAIRDIYPKWAQIFDLNCTISPFDKDIYGSANSLKTALYFPGLMRNHGIRFRFETEVQTWQKRLLYNRASFPRSYKNIISKDLRFYSVDYAMPLFYPDLNIPGLIFINRVRSTLFFDQANGRGNAYLNFSPTLVHNYAETFRSYGFELLSDFYLLRIPFRISGGVQSAWKTLNKPPSFELLLNVDIFGMKIGRNRL